MKNADQLDNRLADRRTFTKEDRTEFKKWLGKSFSEEATRANRASRRNARRILRNLEV